MTTITIPKRIAKNDDLIVIPRKEYEQMKSMMFPMVNLVGKSADRLDRRVVKALRYYKQGRTRTIKSLADLG